jgi:hypothetical protein
MGNSEVVLSLQTLLVGGSATAGAVDGPIATATFNNPVNVAVDSDGSVYVCDYDNDRVRKIRNGQVTTLVSAANFSRPFGITIAPDGTLYVQTDANDAGDRNANTGTIWRVNKATGASTVVVRNIGRPRGITALTDGRLALANLTIQTIALLDPATGVVTQIAGLPGTSGFSDGNGTGALFNRPYGLTQMSNGDLLVADQGNIRIRRVTLSGVVTTFAGTGAVGSANGNRLSATFNNLQDVKRDPLTDLIYVSDSMNHTIRRITGSTVETIAGDGTAGYAEGIGTAARFFYVEGIAVDSANGFLYIADGNGGEGDPFNRVRRLKL